MKKKTEVSLSIRVSSHIFHVLKIALSRQHKTVVTLLNKKCSHLKDKASVFLLTRQSIIKYISKIMYQNNH